MKLRPTLRTNSGISLFEVGVVVAIVMVLVLLLLQQLASPSKKSSKINCVNNLKQVGLAYRIWSGDNADQYPMGISISNGGAREMLATGNVVQVFQVMSNELSTPKIIYCPEDKARTIATNGYFTTLAPNNISYFVAVDTTNEVHPTWLLGGDDHLQRNGKALKAGLWSLGTNDALAWIPPRHPQGGNVLLSDGSVQYSVTSRPLTALFTATEQATNRLAIP